MWKGESAGRDLNEEHKDIDVSQIMGEEHEESAEMEKIELSDSRKLAIATLGTLK